MPYYFNSPENQALQKAFLEGRLLSSSGEPLTVLPSGGELYLNFSLEFYQKSFKEKFSAALEINEKALSSSLTGTDKLSLKEEELEEIFEDEILYSNGNIKKGKSFRNLDSYYLIELKEISDLLTEVIYRAYLGRVKYIFQEMPRSTAISELERLASVYQAWGNKAPSLLPYDLPVGFYATPKGGPQHIAERLSTLAKGYSDFLLKEETRLFGKESNFPSHKAPSGSHAAPLRLEFLAKSLRDSTVKFSDFSSGKGWENFHKTILRNPVLYKAYSDCKRLEVTLRNLLREYREVSLNGTASKEDIEQAQEKVIDFFSPSNTELVNFLHVLTDRTPFSNQDLPLRERLSLMQGACIYYKICKQLIKFEECSDLNSEGRGETDPSIKDLIKTLEASMLHIANKTFCSSRATELFGDTALLSKKDFVKKFTGASWEALTAPLEEYWEMNVPIAGAIGDTCKVLNKLSETLLGDTDKIKVMLSNKDVETLIKNRYGI